MESHAKLFGHPIHQIAVMFPIGMLAFTAVCDVMHSVKRKRIWSTAARTALGAGLVGAGVAAPFGLVDYLAIPRGTRAKRIGGWHALGNAAVLSLFLTSWLLRERGSSPRGVALSSLALLGLGGTAWLGTELINRLGVGVYSPTSLDAKSSRSEPVFASV
jgi:uncharacterized membrane protein